MLNNAVETRRRFLEAGFSDQQADSLVAAFESGDERLATKEDLEQLRTATKEDLEQLRLEVERDLARVQRDIVRELSAQFNDRFDRLHGQLHLMVRWSVGAIIIIGAIMTTLLAIAEFA